MTDLSAYESWLGRPVENVLSFFNQSSWEAFDDSIPYGIDLWAHAGRPVIWSVPLVVNGSSLAQAAAGEFDEHYRAAAEAVAASRTDGDPIYIRLGWEFNTDHMPWGAAGHEADFIAAFQRASEIFDSVSDRFKMVWDVNIGGGNMNPADAYPGDGHVDVVGLDIYYNTAWDSPDPEQAFAYSVSREYGLQWVQDFASAHGKPTAISEWGVESNDAGGFVESIAGWMADHQMVYGNYWESNAGGFDGQLRSGAYPAAGLEFKETFGNHPQPDTLELRVSADSYHGDPLFVVSVDGQQVGGVHAASASYAADAFDTVVLKGDFGPNPQSVAVTFINDGWGGSPDLDRNLYVAEVALNGNALSGADAHNPVGSHTGDATALYQDGTATWALHGHNDWML